MAWFRAITFLDWDIVVFWCMVASSLLFLLVLLATVFSQEEQKSVSKKYDNQRKTLHELLGQKLLPIEPSLGWQLVGVFNNLRVWTRQLFLPSNRSGQTLHGCCAIVAAEAEDILAAVQNITKQREWDPTIASITQSSPPRLINSLDEENPIMMDVVRITTSSHCPTFHCSTEPVQNGSFRASLRHALDGYLRRLPKFMAIGMHPPDEAVGVRDIVINRIWKVERDNSCWMFNKNEDNRATVQSPWCYILIQPILESAGKSVIHYILSPSSESGRTPQDVGKHLAIQLAALRQYIKHTSLKLCPLTHTTLQHISDLLPVTTDDNKDDESLTMQDAVEEKGRSRASHGKRGEGEAAEVKNIRTTTASKLKPARKSLSPSGKFRKTTPSRSRRYRLRACGVGGNAGGGAGAETDSSSSEDTGYSDWMSNKGSLEREGKAPGVVTSDPGVMTSMIDYMLCDDEPTSLKDECEGLYTLANQCTTELLGQSNQVAAINVNSSVAQQKAQTGGWFFHSLAKEVVILQKSPVQGKYHCFLGKGLIRAPPEEVFKAVKNPRTRFIYDNMLKKMDIIKEIDDKVQIVHAVHEVPQLLRKESRDFCILQASKIEGTSHIVSFTSVNVAECPPLETITRSHVLPSGWIIEPVGDNTGSYSMVTYITQVSVGTKGVPTSFIHFLSKRVPLSIAYLRTFVEAENM